jgi:hypothetical protein
MTTNNTLRIAELDFDTIKENLKNYLRSQSEFQDFDFEGSGMSVLLDILAYNTHYMGYYLNMVGNEMFLDTAQIRASVLSHAKAINYVPASKKGAQAVVNITVTPSDTEDNNVNIITLDRYTRFLGQDIGGVNYPFVALYSNNAAKVNGSFSFANVIIKQGEVSTFQYEMNSQNTNRRFEIPSANVDTTTLIVTVQESSSNVDTKVYTLADDITTLTANSEVYFIEENENLNYTIYFGDDVIGKRPRNGNIITVSYVDNVGSLANKIGNFVATDTIDGFRNNVIINSVSSSFSGSDKETLDQIRYRAPYFYSTQNRAVTTLDYTTLITKDYPNIDSISVWGGDDNDPPIYGKVFLSLKTTDNTLLSNAEKERIKNELIENRNVLTVIPEIIDPEITYLLIRGSVFYNPTIAGLTNNQLYSLAIAAIQDYEDTELNQFNSTFRKSKLQNQIESVDKSVTGTDIRVFLQKRIAVDTTQAKKYTINANFPIKKGDFNNQISSFPQLNVLDASNIQRQVFFEEVPSAFTGVDGVDIVNPGINFTTAPTVTIIGDGTGATAIARITSGRISSIDITNKGINYSRATISITGGGGSEASAVARLESKFGKLRTYYTKTNGEKVIVNDNAGTINYETGLIELISLRTSGTVENDFYDDNVLTLNLPIDREIITPLRNRILTIDQNDPTSIQIDVIAE